MATSVAGGYFYSGYFVDLNIMLHKRNHSIYCGPLFLLSDFYLPGDVTTGIGAGWQYFLYNPQISDRLNFCVSVDYQFIPYKVKYLFEKSSRINQIHTINAGYGLKIKIYNNIYVISTISAGIYFDLYHNSFTRKRDTITGLNTLIKLYVKYKFDE